MRTLLVAFVALSLVACAGSVKTDGAVGAGASAKWDNGPAVGVNGKLPSLEVGAEGAAPPGGEWKPRDPPEGAAQPAAQPQPQPEPSPSARSESRSGGGLPSWAWLLLFAAVIGAVYWFLVRPRLNRKAASAPKPA